MKYAMNGRVGLCLGLLLVATTVQAADLTGVVRDAEHRTPLAGVQVEALAADGLFAGRAETDSLGRFRISGLGPGAHVLVFVREGFTTARLEGVLADGPQAAVVQMVLYAARLGPEVVLVTASRTPESDLRAPASTSVIGRDEIDLRSQFTPVDLARTAPGVDFASKGLVQHTFAARGPRGAMSSGLLVLTDHRYAGLPVLDFNLSYLIPLTAEDLERIEIVRGPGAALYGPNSDQGVMHIITRSPLDTQGTTVSVAAGERSVFQGAFRHSEALGADVAVKLSGQIFRGDDWTYHDPVEVRNRQAAIDAGADPDTLRIGRRDFGIEQTAGEVRLDARLGAESLLVLAGGLAQTSNLDQANTVGGVQAEDWRNGFLQGRLEHGRLRANVFYNATNSGDAYALRTGQPIVDRSRVLAVQLRHGAAVAARHDLLYGLDARRSDPRTGGTLHGRNEDNDVTSEFGGYLNLRSTLTSQWDLVGALRVDYHDRINDLAVSPRLGAVYQPAPEHAFRLTWNRAFSSPNANDLFMDYPVADLGGMAVRVRGVPKDGWRFRRHEGTYLMYTPLNAAGAAAPLPADASLVWDNFRPVLQQVLGGIAPDIAAQLEGLEMPGGGGVATDMGYLDPRTNAFLPLDGTDIGDVGADERVITSAFELGYKGRLGDRVSLAVDAYRTHVTNFFGELYAATPSVLFDEATLRDYFIGQGLSVEDAAVAANVAGRIPVGTVAPEGQASPDLLMANRQGGAYTVWGADLAVDWRISRALGLTGTYSWISGNTFLDQPQVGVMCLSVPRNKGSLGARWTDAGRGLDGLCQLRAVEAFPVISGVYVGDVPAYAVVDLGAGYRFPWEMDTHLSVSVSNLLDTRHREFVGSPELGRLVTSRLRVRF